MRTFTKLYDHVVLDEDPRMTNHAKLVYCFLLRFEESEDIKQIFTSREYIGKHTLLSVSAVKRAIATLIEVGLITITPRQGHSHLYQVQPYSAKDRKSQNDRPGSHRPDYPVLTDPTPGSHRPTMRLSKRLEEEISLKDQGQNHSFAITGCKQDDDVKTTDQPAELSCDRDNGEESQTGQLSHMAAAAFEPCGYEPDTWVHEEEDCTPVCDDFEAEGCW